jgi:membrane protease subunit HflK
MSDQPKKSGQLKLTPTPVTSADDASSQALSEALGSSFIIVRILAVVLLAAFVFSCVFTVNPNEVAIVLRFGKPVGTGPDMLKKQGLHWAFPYPIDEIVRLKVGETKTVRASQAWFAISPEQEAAGVLPEGNPFISPSVEGHTLTSDGNILHVRATMKYRISDPVAYGFNFSNATNLLINALNNAVYHASARFTADAALYLEVAAFNDAVRQRMEQWIVKSALGVTLDTLEVERSAPLYVKSAFDAVQAAGQDRSKKINDAQGYADETIRRAEGEAAAIRAGGMVASNLLVQAISAESKFFGDQLASYRRAPDLFRTRLLTATISDVLTNATDKFFLPDRADGAARELRIQLNREPVAPRNPNAPGPDGQPAR